jgi:hypothetical protein
MNNTPLNECRQHTGFAPAEVGAAGLLVGSCAPAYVADETSGRFGGARAPFFF